MASTKITQASRATLLSDKLRASGWPVWEYLDDRNEIIHECPVCGENSLVLREIDGDKVAMECLHGCSISKIMQKAKISENDLGNTITGGPPLQETMEIIRKAASGRPSAKTGRAREGLPRLDMSALAEIIEEMGCAVKYNVITARVEISGTSETGRQLNLEDLVTLLHDHTTDSFKGITFETLQRYVTFLAMERRYNPVLDLLESTTWDGINRLPDLYRLIGIESDDLSKSLVNKWFLQAVALLYNGEIAGAELYGADGVLVFNGEQGAGKTSLFRHLALQDRWFGEGLAIDDHDKDTTRRVVTKWIAELGEVESTLKSDLQKLKAFITTPFDAYRLPYAKSDTEQPRHTALCATCNSDRYLIDPTGNRRFWSVPFRQGMGRMGREDLLKLDALQLWAQFHTIVAPMTPAVRASCYRLTPSEAEALAIRNGAFEKPIKAQMEIEDILTKSKAKNLKTRVMTITDFRRQWIDVLRPFSVQQISTALRKCGIEVKPRKVNGVVIRAAELPESSLGWDAEITID